MKDNWDWSRTFDNDQGTNDIDHGTFDIDQSISNVPWSLSFVLVSISNVPDQCQMSPSHYQLSPFSGDIWYWLVILTRFKLYRGKLPEYVLETVYDGVFQKSAVRRLVCIQRHIKSLTLFLDFYCFALFNGSWFWLGG